VERAEAERIYDAGRDACVEFLLELTARYEREVARLEARVARLEEQARSSSRTSSKPPSQDPPKTRQQRRAEARAKAKALLQKEAEGRCAGGQPGHPGAGRELLPEDQVDEIVEHYPDCCQGCGHEFSDEERSAARSYGRHQLAELPPITVIVSEHRTYRLRCPRCTRRTSATLPPELAGSAFGPRLQAAVVTLSARNRISRRGMSELAGDLFGLELSVGTVEAICQRASAALEEPHERLVASLLEANALNVDETGWFRAGQERTLWAAASPTGAVFRIAADRHLQRLQELLGDYDGIVCSDRWWAYEQLDPARRQVCWSHLARDFRRHAEGSGEQQRFGEAGLALTGRLFQAWRSFQSHRDRRRLTLELTPIQQELRSLLEQAGRKSSYTRFHRVFANKLLNVWPALWTFSHTNSVEPTNNAAERALRGPVIQRKLSHGNHSEQGERFSERALSASVSCRLQHRSLFTYLTELLTAHARGDPLPSLA
jgi:transposase